LLVFALLPLVLFVFKVGKLIYLYRSRVGANTIQTLAAAFAGLALSHTIGIAMLTGFVKKGLPFFRTPKQASKQALVKALQAAREEALLLVALFLAVGGVIGRLGTESLDLLMWSVMLLLQCIPYAAALLVSVISAFPQLPSRWIGEIGNSRESRKPLPVKCSFKAR
jgi:hypothetical protein